MIIAAIPVKNQIRWTAPLVEGLLWGDQIDELWLYDNGSTDKTKEWIINRARIDSRIKYFYVPQMRIYDMWNDMIKRASTINESKLAILNNDIRLPFMALKNMYDAMNDYKVLMIDKTINSFYHINNVVVEEANWWDKTGWAFMIDPHFWINQEWAIHPGLKFWWGDDDLFRRCQNGGGKIGIAKGIGCDHLEHSSDSEYNGDRIKDIEEDREFFKNLWGDEYA
jgi:glycosyltransferase involved in cell wall biosynthesis